MEDHAEGPRGLGKHAHALSEQMGATLRHCQQHLGQLCTSALAAGAQMQISTCQNIHNLADALAHPSFRPVQRRRCRPSMMCCLSSAAGGTSTSSGGSVRFPKSTDAAGLQFSRDASAAEANATDSAAEEPILISEVSQSQSRWLLGTPPSSRHTRLRAIGPVEMMCIPGEFTWW